MNDQSRRYVFIDFENLKTIKFKKLEKVCDRIFVFINAKEDSIPFTLVQQMQKLGKGVKWIAVENPVNNDMSFHISFLMGKMHQKVSSDIEFAILSNEDAFDPLIDFINNTSRSCIRVKNGDTRQYEEEHSLDLENEEVLIDEEDFFVEDDLEEFDLDSIEPQQHDFSKNGNGVANLVEAVVDVEMEEDVIEKTAEETIRRLIRSGNRPAEVSMLKSYILLHNQQLGVHGNIDKILNHMEETKDIKMNEEEVIYNF